MRELIAEVLDLLVERRLDAALVTTETAVRDDAPDARLSYTTNLVLRRENDRLLG